jgi:hypothetical protein
MERLLPDAKPGGSYTPSIVQKSNEIERSMQQQPPTSGNHAGWKNAFSWSSIVVVRCRQPGGELLKCSKAPSPNDEFITTLLPAMDPSSSHLFICLRSLSPRIDTRACSSSYSIEAESSFSISGHFPTNQIGIGRLIGTQSSQRSYWPTVAACWMDWWTRAQKVADATNISCAPADFI